MIASNSLLVSMDDDICQQVIPTNQPGPQESKREKISVIVNDGIGSDMHKRNKYISTVVITVYDQPEQQKLG